MRSRLRPGSFLWLLLFGVRMAARRMGLARYRLPLLIAAALLLAGYLALFALLSPLRAGGTFAGVLAELLPSAGGAALGAWVLSLFLLSGAVAASLHALWGRGDLDLLLSSPVSPRAAFASRLAGVWLAVGAFPLLLAALLALLGLALGEPALLGLPPLALALSGLTAAAGMGLTLMLARTLGPGRARGLTALLAGLLGPLLYVGFVLRLGGERPLLAGAYDRAARTLDASSPQNPLLWPGLALLGQPLPLFALMALAALALWAALWALGRHFGAGVPSAARRRARAGTFRFRGGDAALLLKEWRVLLRDYKALVPVVSQGVIFAVIFLGGGRAEGELRVLSLAVLVVGFSMGLTAAFSTRSRENEEAPDLLRAAPVGLWRIRTRKAAAAFAPPALVGALAGLALGVGQGNPGLALLTAALTGYACAGRALLGLSQPLPEQARNLDDKPGGSLPFAVADVAYFVLAMAGSVGLLLALWLRQAGPGELGPLAVFGPLAGLGAIGGAVALALAGVLAAGMLWWARER